MAIKIRKATCQDLPILRDFEQRLVSYERKIEETLVQEGSIQYYDLEELLGSQIAHIVLVEIEGRSIGCGLIDIRDNFPFHNKKQYGYLGLIYVDENYRGQNIGTQIVDKLVGWAKLQGISEIRLQVYASNLSAIKSYKKQGFQSYIEELKLSI